MSPDASRVTRVSPGRHQLSREFIVRHQRERIMRALAEVVADQGYQAATVADVVKRARIARNTFYENFSSKGDCFLAAFDHGAAEALSRVTEACRDSTGGVEGDFAARARAGVGAFLAYMAEEPALGRLCIVDALSAGVEAMGRYERAIAEFVPLLRPGRELAAAGDALPDSMEETVLGGVTWIVYQRLAADQAEGIESLTPKLVEFALTPYLGPAAAREAASAGETAEP